MNILELTKSLHKGGVEKHILDLSENLMRYGHSVIVGSDNLIEKEAFERRNIKLYRINFMSKNPISLINNIRQLRKLITDNQIDVIHCHWRICCLYVRIYNIVYGKKIPYIWTCHLAGMNTSFFIRKMSFFDKYIIGCSSDCSEMVINTFKIEPNRVYTIYNGIYVLKENERIKIEETGKFRVTILSRMSPIKNHTCMLRALQRLVYDYQMENIVLQITGDGDEQYKSELLELCRSLQIKDYVEFCGFVEPYDILAKTDVMVLPSDFEGFPISVLEAFNMMVPVVRTKTGGYSDVKEYCWAFEFNDDEQLAYILSKMYSGKINTFDRTEAAYEFLKKNCSVDVMTERIEKIYEKAIND